MAGYRTTSTIAAAALLLSACGIFADEIDIAAAQEQFCSDVQDYVVALDEYGGLFTDLDLTVGDVKSAGERLEPARDAVLASADEFRTAVEEGSSPGVNIEIVDPETLEAVRRADAAFTTTAEGIGDDTPIGEAGVAFTSAAYALQVAWVRVFADAGCLDDETAAQASQWVADYVAALQTDLRTAGYYSGEIDGIYGPGTIEAVERLQGAVGLPVTGLPDPATQAALSAALGGQASAQIGALQGILITTGYYPGPVDGQWSPQLEEALKAFQTDLGVEPTGVVDAETLRAFEEALAEEGEPPATTTTTPEQTTTTAPPQTTTAPPVETTTTAAPPETTTTTVPVEAGILEVLAESGQFTQLLAAIEAAGLTETLGGPGPFTLFAPPDDVISQLDPPLPTGPTELQGLLLYHVVQDELSAFELAQVTTVVTAQGGEIAVTLDGGFIVLNDTTTITITNVVGGNGVVHVVNAVLIPAI
jgi:peptidoglycan hydrolase-like protein with peptidoglycan-binding domain